MDLYGRAGEDPRALASEGHLDSLGLCIFLAFVKNFYADCSIIALDDVVTTVDSLHRSRVCKLIFEEFADKQFIITTHDAIWNDQLRAHQRSYHVQSDFRNIEIIKWDVNCGPYIDDHKSNWELIEDRIGHNDKRSAGNLTRQSLEKVLIKLALNFQVTGIVFKYSLKYEVWELYEPTKNRLKKLIGDDTFRENFERCILELENTQMMGNLLSHYNLDAENFSIDEVRGFLYAVKGLDDTFQCPTCQNDMKYFRELKILRCSSPRCNTPYEIKAN
jgi:hypothetical protein